MSWCATQGRLIAFLLFAILSFASISIVPLNSAVAEGAVDVFIPHLVSQPIGDDPADLGDKPSGADCLGEYVECLQLGDTEYLDCIRCEDFPAYQVNCAIKHYNAKAYCKKKYRECMQVISNTPQSEPSGAQ